MKEVKLKLEQKKERSWVQKSLVINKRDWEALEKKVSEISGTISCQKYIIQLIKKDLENRLKFKKYTSKKDSERIRKYYKFFYPITNNLNQIAKKLNQLNIEDETTNDIKSVVKELENLVKTPLRKLLK